ncbi:DUF3000 domain-containing protein [Actinomyces vulturis]|uniref:DUF3000 domain-containing protein n=1 Tax=Actinomyces vulturis TaxID=1857645 RepID=UPI00082C2999|nr:DUF3000 domain-containing protein [Actinomyces vulturis]
MSEKTITEGDIPPSFARALLSIRDARRPNDVVLEEIPSPTRLAPYTAALNAQTVAEDQGVSLGSGRFVILHDPDGQEAWGGTYRLVVMVKAKVDHDIAVDPCLGEVAWSWMADALECAGAGYHHRVGTVTRVMSETFGGLELSDSCAHIEIRASWTPVTDDLTPHCEAWFDLIRVACGHEPGLIHPLQQGGEPR